MFAMVFAAAIWSICWGGGLSGEAEMTYVLFYGFICVRYVWVCKGRGRTPQFYIFAMTDLIHFYVGEGFCPHSYPPSCAISMYIDVFVADIIVCVWIVGSVMSLVLSLEHLFVD